MTNEKKTLLWRETILGLNDTGRAGSRELAEIEKAFGSVLALRQPTSLVLRQISTLSGGLARALRKESLEPRGQRVLQMLDRHGLHASIFGDEDYPQGLHALANPPLVLFYKGKLPGEGQRRVAIVGARACSRYGKRMARTLGRDLALRGIEVTSGLARGVDREAHEGALEGGGVTHGILGCGLPRIYPSEHWRLADQMMQNGSVICEFSPDTPPLPGNFPRRNRIIAALCDGLVLVEAKEKSGGLITVRWAADLGRNVFVLPGQIDNPLSAGCLSLMRDGVGMVRHVDDLMSDMRWPSDGLESHAQLLPQSSVETMKIHLTANEERLLACLDHEALPLDALLPALDQTPGQVLTGLLSLELKGLVEQEAGMRFRRKGKGESEGG